MNRTRNEQTIEKAASISGRGYWSGAEVNVCFRPAPSGSGIRFVRTDLPGMPVIPALATHRESMSLRTVLKTENGSAMVSMVEHLLAALYALDIDNCRVEVDAEEMPGLDGSAMPFVEVLQSAVPFEQDTAASPYVVDRTLRIGNAASWIEASPANGMAGFEVEYQLDYGDDCPIPKQIARCQVTPATFARQLAPARTFVTSDQAQQLRAAGVASHVTTSELLFFDEGGLVDNELLFENECARHKALDMVGDLALTGFPIAGRFVSHRGGHELNAAMAIKLMELNLRSKNYRATA